MIDIDRIEQLAKAAPAGKWEIHTSNSWRRIYANHGREKVCVIEPTTQHDRWPDLMFGPGVPEFLEGLTPDVVLALIAEVRALRADSVTGGARVESYSLPDLEIEIIRVKQRSGPDKWKVFHGGCYCLNKSGQWEFEPMPSSRDEGFIERCRFDTAQDAIDAARGAE